MNRYTQASEIALSRRKADAFLNAARTRIANGSDVSSVMGALYSTVNNFYERLRQPVTKRFWVRPDDPRSLDDYEAFLMDVQRDLNILFDEASAATKALSNGFNYIDIINSQVKFKAQKIASTSEDLALLADDPSPDIFIAGDSFADESRIDRFFQGVSVNASLAPGGGAVTLQRSGTEKITEPGEVSVDIQTRSDFPYDPAAVLQGRRQDDPGRDFRVYEGHYYHYSGRMDPAGGVLRWITLHVDNSGQEIEPTNIDVSSDEGPDADARRAEQERILNAQSIIVPDTPTPEELGVVRDRMFDDNPDTFWQIESTYNPFHFTDEDAFRAEYGGLTPTQRAEAFRSILTATEEKDFDVFVTLDLGEPKIFNWLNLSPENFGEEAWLEILSIDTASTLDGPWTPIEGLFEHRFENTLTPEANQELTDAEVAATMSPSRYRYAGQGVWQFPPREAQFVRVGVRQKTPVPSPYHVVRYKLVRNVTVTTTKTRKRGIFS